jgi:hypothetical protein
LGEVIEKEKQRNKLYELQKQRKEENSVSKYITKNPAAHGLRGMTSKPMSKNVGRERVPTDFGGSMERDPFQKIETKVHKSSFQFKLSKSKEPKRMQTSVVALKKPDKEVGVIPMLPNKREPSNDRTNSLGRSFEGAGFGSF